MPRGKTLILADNAKDLPSGVFAAIVLEMCRTFCPSGTRFLSRNEVRKALEPLFAARSSCREARYWTDVFPEDWRNLLCRVVSAIDTGCGSSNEDSDGILKTDAHAALYYADEYRASLPIEEGQHPEDAMRTKKAAAIAYQRALSFVAVTGCAFCGTKRVHKKYWNMDGGRGVRACQACQKDRSISDYQLDEAYHLSKAVPDFRARVLDGSPYETVNLWSYFAGTYSLRIYWIADVLWRCGLAPDLDSADKLPVAEQKELLLRPWIQSEERRFERVREERERRIARASECFRNTEATTETERAFLSLTINEEKEEVTSRAAAQAAAQAAAEAWTTTVSSPGRLCRESPTFDRHFGNAWQSRTTTMKRMRMGPDEYTGDLDMSPRIVSKIIDEVLESCFMAALHKDLTNRLRERSSDHHPGSDPLLEDATAEEHDAVVSTFVESQFLRAPSPDLTELIRRAKTCVSDVRRMGVSASSSSGNQDRLTGARSMRKRRRSLFDSSWDDAVSLEVSKVPHHAFHALHALHVEDRLRYVVSCRHKTVSTVVCGAINRLLARYTPANELCYT